MVAQEVVAGDDGIAASHERGEAPRSTRTVAPLGRVGIAQENRIVEVEEEHPGGPPQERQLPGRQELALKDNQVRSAQLTAQQQARKERPRPRTQG